MNRHVDRVWAVDNDPIPGPRRRTRQGEGRGGGNGHPADGRGPSDCESGSPRDPDREEWVPLLPRVPANHCTRVTRR